MGSGQYFRFYFIVYLSPFLLMEFLILFVNCFKIKVTHSFLRKNFEIFLLLAVFSEEKWCNSKFDLRQAWVLDHLF